MQVDSKYKYLGILIDSHLFFKSSIKKICHQVKYNFNSTSDLSETH